MEKTLKGTADLGQIMAVAASVAIGFVVFIVTLTLGGSLLATMGATQAINSTGAFAAGNGSLGLLQVSGQSTNMGLVIGIVIILTILVGGLGFFLYNRSQE